MTDFQSLAEDCSDSEEEALRILQQATDAVVEACELQLGLELKPEADTAPPDQGCSTYGSGIALTAPTGGFNLMLVGDEESTNTLTRKLLFLGEDADVGRDDVADALGELVNMAAGAVKTKRPDDKPDLQLGLPLFLTGSGCIEFLAEGVYAAAKPLQGPDDIRAQMVIIWRGAGSK